MVVLQWDQLGDRKYEAGVDHGVIYLPSGVAVPWNGLTSVVEKTDRETTQIYYDGMKINDLVVLGEFKASVKAITYPDELMEIDGLSSLNNGVYIDNQPPQPFALCYRTLISNDLDANAGYKIHVVYNVTLVPSDKTYDTLSDSPSPTEFTWELLATPEEHNGVRPSSHVIFDSRDLDPILIEEIEDILYGSDTTEATLLPMPEFVSYLQSWARVSITDNGDGTWTASSDLDGVIDLNELTQEFTIYQANVVYLDADTYQISDTKHIDDIS